MASNTVLAPQPVQIVEPDDGFSLRLARKPDAIIAEARLCAEALVSAVQRNGWVQKFGGRDHLFFEAWSFLASMYRVTPRTRETRLVQIGDVSGYEAFAEAFHIPSGIVIGMADSMCLDDEPNWDTRPEYDYIDGKRRKVGDRPVPLFQLRSMAQTRAQAKALKGPFSWIVAMAGYAPVAAEEMTGKEKAAAGPSIDMPQRKAAEGTPGSGPRLISEPQRKRLWGIAKSAGIENTVVYEIAAAHGFDHTDKITTDKYDAICHAIEAKGAPVAAHSSDF